MAAVLKDETLDNLDNLKARCEAIGYRLFVTTEGTQLVTETTTDGIEIVFIHETDGDDDLEEWIADREQVSARVRQEARGVIPAERATDDEEHDEPTAKELLGQCWHHLHGIEQIAAMLYDNADQTEEAYGSAHAIKHLAATAHGLIDTAKDRMGTAVTPAVIAMSQRLKKLGYKLLADATTADVFSVVKVRPGPEITWHLFIVSLDEIDAWIEREGLKGGAA